MYGKRQQWLWIDFFKLIFIPEIYKGNGTLKRHIRMAIQGSVVFVFWQMYGRRRQWLWIDFFRLIFIPEIYKGNGTLKRHIRMAIRGSVVFVYSIRWAQVLVNTNVPVNIMCLRIYSNLSLCRWYNRHNWCWRYWYIQWRDRTMENSRRLEINQRERRMRRGKLISCDTNLAVSAQSDPLRTGFHWDWSSK